MSKSLPPPRRQAYRASMSTPPRTPPLSNDTTLPPGPPSVAGSSASGVDALSSTDMESHLAAFESLGPPGASRRPTRRVRSIERTWQWVKSRSSVYGEASLLDPTDEEGTSPTSTLVVDNPGPSRPLTVAAMGASSELSPTTASVTRRQSAADIDPEERRRRRQGLTPESGLRPPPRPRPASRSFTTPPAGASSGASLSSSASNGSSSGVNVSARHNTTMMPATRDRPRPLPIIPPKPGTKVFPGAVPSIHDIVKRHSTAVALAEEGVKDRARAELASHPDILLAAARERRASIKTRSSPLSTSPTRAPAVSPPSPQKNTKTKASSSSPSHRREPSSHGTLTDASDTDSVVREIRLAQAAYDHLTPKSSTPANAPVTPVQQLAPAPTPPPTATPTPSATAFAPQARSMLSSPTPDQSPRSKYYRGERDRDRVTAASPDPEQMARNRSTTSIVRPKSASPLPPDDEAHAMALYLRSAQLNRIILIPRPYPERPLQVSFADLGKPDGRPVVVFLGLGCVRYLVALYDDLARALGLRLICIDRWGLGKTGQVPQNQRGLLDWADVVRHVLDELGVERFQIIAHSAGAPYALATVLKMESRVHGKIHLLAPWVGGDPEGYKWLKWVPNTVIKSALAAEWRLESYFLGKAPTIKPVRGKPEAMMSSTSLDSDGSRSRTSFAQDNRPESRTADNGPDGFGTLGNDYVHLPSQWSGSGTASSTVTSVSSSPGFPQALLQASHAESLSGTTADLLSVVLGRDAKPWGFSYTDIRHPCKIWYGADDDRVSEKSMRWMERAMDAELIVVQEEGHNLMSSRIVMFDVLDSLAEDI